MKIDTHVLFLILIVGIISAGLVGANVLNSDQSMKQEVFDGIKVSVPSDSNFVKTGDGVYKDSKYGITLHTFKNNDSMIKFLKNTKNSKVVPIENQPPQSVAFKKGDTINILVTNGKEGVNVASKDGELSAKIANNVIFSDNHKTQKPAPLNIINPPMDAHDDFNLILVLMADVDTKIFNLDVYQNNVIPLVVDNYNENINQANFINNLAIVNDSGESSNVIDNSYSDNVIANNTSNSSDVDDAIIQDPNDSNSSGGNELTASFEDISKTNEADSSADSSPSSSASSSSASSSSPQATASPASSSSPSSASPASSPSSSSSSSPSSSSPSSSSSSSSSNTAKYTYADCKKLVMDSLPSSLTIDERPGAPEQSGNDYIFHIKDSTNKDKGVIRVDSTTGKIDDSGLTS